MNVSNTDSLEMQTFLNNRSDVSAASAASAPAPAAATDGRRKGVLTRTASQPTSTAEDVVAAVATAREGTFPLLCEEIENPDRAN